MLYHVGDSQHTPNIQNNKVIGENEECVFYFTEKNIQTFWPTQYYRQLYAHKYDNLDKMGQIP